MGNAHHKKKAQQVKAKPFWNFGCNGKIKTAISKPDDDSQLTVHYKAVQHYQENVFLPGNRPQYLEDLHSEAQEGLKSLQQQENQSGNGLDHCDDQSVKSSRTLQPEDEGMFRDRARSVASESTRADTMSLRSELVRTGSTFKPPQTTKNRPAKEKRSRRTTIMGIPQHVQKELGIEKGRDSKRHKAHKKADVADPAQLVNGAEDVVVVPTVDGEVQQKHHKGARVHLQAIEAMHLSKEEKTDRMLKHHIRTVYKDDSVLDHSVAPRVSPMQRPKSLAVPGMTTHSYNEPHSPVMSMSPQATYLSKIIPNAILPSSVEVIEISRSKSRNSVRTVSKSSLVSASPASTRSSLRFYNFNNSDLSSSSSSNWSHSQSSETIVSNSSTLSSGGTKTPNGEEGKEVHRLAPDKMSINSWMSASSGMPQNANGFMMVKQRGDGKNASPAPSTGSAVEGSDTMSIQSDMSFNRNLSVTKMKRPPAPPRRTYSLHHKNKQRDLQGKAVTESQENQSPLSETSSVRSDRLAYSADYSSPDVSRCSAAASPLTAEQMEAREAMLKEQQASSDVSPQKLPFPGNKFERTMSPSSGYSSQSGTPTFSPKGEISYPSLAGRKQAQPVKPERSCSRSSSRTSLSSSVSEPVQHETLLAVSPLAQPPANPLPTKLKPASPVPRVSESVPPALAAVEYDEVFVIPPPPKVHAPSPPPPETWMLNKRTFDSLRSSTSQLATSGDVQQQLKKEPAPAQKEETPPVLKTVEPPVQTETLIVKKEVPPVFKKGFKPIQHETQPIVKKEVPPVFKKEYKPACVDSLFIIKKEVLPVFKMQTPPVIKKEVPPEQTETHPILKKETPLIVKKEPPPVQKKETPPIVKKETPPIVKKETPPIVKKETPPIVKKETPPIVQKETPPIVQKETPPIVQKETPPIVQKETPPIVKKETPPIVKKETPPIVKKETPPIVQKETPAIVQKETPPIVQKETLPIVQKETPPVFKKETLPIVKSETPPLIKKEVPPVFKETIPVQEIPLLVKKESPPIIKREIQPEVKEDVHPVLKNETPPVQRKEVLPEQNVVQDVEPIPAVQASPSPPPSPPPAHLPPPPPTKKTPSESSASSPPPLPDPEVCQVLPAAEPLWPPPPPSLEEPVLFFTSQEESDFSFPPPPPPVDHISQTSIETLSTVELPAKSAGSEVVPTPPPENSSESTAILVTVVGSSETTKPTFQLQKAQEIPAAPPLPMSNGKPKESVATSGSPSLSITAQPTPQKPPEAPCPPPAPPLVNIKRQQSLINQEVKAKEPLSRTKSTPAPKEEASIPLVTPSLLQMVRLRSVNVGSYQPDEQPKSPVEENKPSPVNGTTVSQTVPQKPVRKSLSFKSPPGTSSALPSMKLQEAIRMKTAAMSSKDMPPHSLSRPNLRASFTPTSPPSSDEHGQTSLRTPEEGGVLKSPASTASFIFSRSSKKVVIETSVSPEAQTDLKRNLVAELMSTSQKKTGKVPPPVAKKPTHIPSSPSPQGAPLSPLMKMAGPLKEQHAVSPTQGGQGGSESSVAADSTPAPTGPAGTVQLAGQQAQPKEGIALKSNHETGVTEAVTS
ncbi:uncharacterized protein KIAA1522-like isoform X2 [Acipenser ruthenus]|uniref:uncharacterized protein KIAA1522-like isoform X2 n=1 Tax=Acipenser ruthenus TaxID=7906 RepID=UPI0027421981|nr:uncharacterized protein KIAA1522-like isoform X2 [Acipenser ruthenus]